MGFFDRWKYFEAEELLSPGGLSLLYMKGVFPLQFRALDKLSELRDVIKKPILVNHAGINLRGFRTPEENYNVQKGIGSDPWRFSFHVAGCAFDITVKDLTPKQVADAATSQGWTGIGIYKTWTHIDLREGRSAFWEQG